VNPKHRNLATRPILALAVLASVGLLTAAPAQAADEFENGFQDELGRLVAHEVVRAGATLLYGPYYAAGAVYTAPLPVRSAVYEARHRQRFQQARCAHGRLGHRHALRERAKRRHRLERRHH
jgi:hypothetical protein